MSPNPPSPKLRWTTATLLALLLMGALGLNPLAPPAQGTNGVSKDMTFLLHFVNATETAKPLPGGGSTLNYFDTTLDFNSSAVSVLVEGTQKVLQWYLSPSLAGSFAADQFTLRIWANSSTGASSSAQVTLEVYEVTSTGSTLINQFNFGSQNFAVTPELKGWAATFASLHTFASGSSIELRMIVNPGALQGVWFHYDTAQYNSRVSFRGPDSLDITGIATLDSARNTTNSFDPTAANQTMYIQTSVTDPLGGYDIRWVNATIFDPQGTILVNNVSMTKVSGTAVAFESVYEVSWNYSGQVNGIYRIGIWALDNNGHNHYFFFSQFTYADYDSWREGSFSIGVSFFVNVRVLDNASLPLGGSEVRATQLGRTIASAITSGTGMVNLTLGSGAYDFIAMWQATQAGTLSVSITSNVTELDPLVIRARVYYPTFRVVDSHGVALAEAALTYTHPNGTTTPTPLLTDANGEVPLARMVGGAYALSVRWRGIEVANPTINVDSTAVFSIAAKVFYVDVHIVDSRGLDVEFASVVVREVIGGLVLDFQLADSTGRATSRLPVGSVEIDVFVQSVPVARVSGFVVDADKAIEIPSAVFYVGFTVLDSRSVPLDGAVVSLESTIGLFSGSTDSLGRATVRVPNGTYALEVDWRGVGVYYASAFAVNGDRNFAVPAGVYYVTFQARDSRSLAVEAAVVTILNQAGEVVNSGSTAANGDVVLRLPLASYNVSVSWKGHPVYSASGLQVSGDANLGLPLDIFYHTVTVVDSRSVVLGDAAVSVVDASGVVLDVGITSEQGTTTLRLPEGSFSILGAWRGVSVLEEALAIDGDGSSTLAAEVFYLTVRVVDSGGNPLSGVIVAVEPMAGTAGALLEFTRTDGAAEFRLPAGSYLIIARLITTYQLTHVDVTVEAQTSLADGSAQVTLTMEGFAPPIHSTNAFNLSLLFVGIIAGLVAFIYLRYHYRKGRGGEGAGGAPKNRRGGAGSGGVGEGRNPPPTAPPP